MVSSKYNTRPVPRKTPCVLHPPPPPELPPDPGTLPAQLSGSALWRDLYAPEFWESFALLDLTSIDGGLTYYGETSVPRGYMALSLERIDALPQWNVNLHIGTDPLPPVCFTWYNVQVDLSKPFDTGLLQDENPLSPPDLYLLQARAML